MQFALIVMFHGEMHDNIIMRKDKKKFCAAARSFWPEACFWDFFGLKRRPSEGQKNPKNRPKAKMNLPQHKIFFVLPHDDIVVHFSMKHYIAT